MKEMYVAFQNFSLWLKWQDLIEADSVSKKYETYKNLINIIVRYSQRV